MPIIVNLSNTQPSIVDYQTLVTAIANWLARDGDVNVTNRISDFIAMAEARIIYGSKGQMESEPLRIRAMETLATLTLTAGNELVALPDGYLGMKRIKVLSTPNTSLQYRTPAMIDQEHGNTTYLSKPYVYTVESENIRLAPVPDIAYQVQILYYQKFPALATASTNWLITNHPSIYLYGALLEAAPYIGDLAMAQGWFASYVSAVNALQAQDSFDRHSGSLSVRADAGNR